MSVLKKGRKRKTKKNSIKYDGKKANITCSTNGKKTYITLTNDQLINIMGMPASKKTLDQRLIIMIKKKTRGKRKKKNRTRKKGKTKKRKRKKIKGNVK